MTQRSNFTALRMSADNLRKVMAARPGVNEALLSYAHGVLVEIADTATSAGSLKVVQRLARFVLKLSGRIDNPVITV
ncbi:MAG: hypothetical protein JWM36_1816, partial [Hyphomicrobiales bacterium]|nr:hypothetical protein [Hyphomicrobiales bacterium]